MSTITIAAPRTWSRLWTEPARSRPTAVLSVRWHLLSTDAQVDTVRVRAGRVPGAWSDTATVRPSSDGSLAVELRLPVEVWAAPAVLDFTVTLVDPAAARTRRTYTLTTAEPFFWNGSAAAIDVELEGYVHEDGAIEPRVTDVHVQF
jgi:hypothetical protein